MATELCGLMGDEHVCVYRCESICVFVYVLQALNEISERGDPVLYPEEEMTSGSLLRYMECVNECICVYVTVWV